MHRNAPHALNARGISGHLLNAVWSKLTSGKLNTAHFKHSMHVLGEGPSRRKDGLIAQSAAKRAEAKLAVQGRDFHHRPRRQR